MAKYPSTVLPLARAMFREEARRVGADMLVTKIAETQQSSRPSEDYVWVGEAPRMDLLEDELRTESLSDASYNLVNNEYKIGIDIREADLEDDLIGGIMARVRGLARVAMGHSERLLINALVAGTTDNCYDGTPLYGNSHPDRGSGAAQDNLLAGSGTTTANLQTDIQTGIQTIATFLAENGEPLHDMVGKFVIVAPWNMRRSIREAINAQIISNTSNVGFSDLEIEPVFKSRLDAVDVNDWYMLHVGGAFKPLIWQERRPLRTQSLDETSDQWVKQSKATFAVSWRGAAGYGHWGETVKFVN